MHQDNKLSKQLDQEESSTYRNSSIPIQINLDNLIEKWFDSLTFRERKVVELVYLNSNRFSIAAASRIISVPQKRAEKFQVDAFQKLSKPDQLLTIEPFTKLLHKYCPNDKHFFTESQIAMLLGDRLHANSYDPAGAIRLVFDIGKYASQNGITKIDLESTGRVKGRNILIRDENNKKIITESNDENILKTGTVSNSQVTTRRDPEPFTSPSSLTEVDVPLIQLGLSSRLYNALDKGKIKTIGQLSALSHPELLRIRNIGETFLLEIDSKLKDYYLTNPQAVRPQTSQKAIDNKNKLLLDKIDYDAPIAVLGLSSRPHNALMRAGITSIGRLIDFSDDELEQINSIGAVSISEILEKKEAYLAKFKTTYPDKVQNDGQTSNLTLTPSLLAKTEHIPLDKIPIERLSLPAITIYTLHKQGLQTVKDLLNHVEELPKNATVLEPLSHYLIWIVEQAPKVWESEIANRGISPLVLIALAETALEHIIDEWLEPLSEREREVIFARFGLLGDEQTLQEVGERLGVTRERVRQIQKKALRKIEDRYSYWREKQFKPFLIFLRYVFKEQGGLLTKTQVVTLLNPKNIGLGRYQSMGFFLLLCEVEEGFEYHKYQHFAALSSYPIDNIIRIQTQFIKILEDRMVATSADEILEMFKERQFYKTNKQNFCDDFLIACLRVRTEIEEISPGLYALVAWQNKIIDEIIMALHELGEPSHYSIITKKTNALLPPDQKASERNVHGHLGRYPDLIVRVGHGIFGLAEWGLHDDGNLANAAFRVLEEAGEPLPLNAITNEVLKTWHVKPESVNMAIQNDNRFSRIRPGIYGLAYMKKESRLKKKNTGFDNLFGGWLSDLAEEFDEGNEEHHT